MVERSSESDRDLAQAPTPKSSLLPPKIAVVGDIHLLWSAFDVEYFNRSDYELILFVGDIAAYRHRGALPIARSIATLEVPAIVMPGNHDAVHLGQLVAEVLERPRVADSIGFGQPRRARQLDRALGRVTMAGYSRHLTQLGGQSISIIAARPHSMGGPRVAFRRHLNATFGVDSIEASMRRMETLIDQCGDEPIVFLAHNGPSGFGARRSDIWGCDFRSEEGDFGDPDLTHAIDYARATGREVLAVVAGHMHHELKGGGQRRWSDSRGGTLFLNAARVPRIFPRDGSMVHHHVELRLDGAAAFATEKLIEAGPRTDRRPILPIEEGCVS